MSLQQQQELPPPVKWEYVTSRDKLLLELTDEATTQAIIIPMYAAVIREHYENNEKFTQRELHEVNIAVINKWSNSGLNYIKEQAWKMLR